MWSVCADASLGYEQPLYAQFDGQGPVFRLLPSGELTEQFTGPSTADLIEEDEAVMAVLEMIKDLPMSRTVRQAIAEKLGVDEEDVGCTPPRKARR